MLCLRRIRSHEVQTEEKVLTWNAFERVPDGVMGKVVGRYGEKFIWTEKHLTTDELDALRQRGDDMQKRQMPDWVDFARVEAGQRVMLKYFPFVGISLFYVSLIGGFSAAVITKTLKKAGGLTAPPGQVFQRLIRTSDFVLRLGLLDIKPNGEAYVAAKKVRAIHDRVRKRIGKDQEEVAINQEDSAVTLLAFSYNVIVGTELLRGRPMSLQEQEDFLHLWRWIGYLLGIELDVCASIATAKASLESIIMHILQPDEDSIALAHHVLKAPPSVLFPGFAFRFRAQLCRLMLGPELADALRLPDFPLYAPARIGVIFFQLAFRAYGFFLDLPLIASLLSFVHTSLARHLLYVRSSSLASFNEKPNSSSSSCPMSS